MSNAKLDDEAAQWLVLHQANGMTRAKRREFNDWLSSSVEALDAYRYAERMWRVAGESRASSGADLLGGGNRSHSWWQSRPTRWAVGSIAAGLAFALVTVPNGLVSYLDGQLAPARGGGYIIDTGADNRWSTKLADGTVVTLDRGTRLQVLEMGARRRIALLAGHAFFKVAKDPAHPFLVTAMNKTVHALGTAFDVRVEPDAVAVTLVEGKVRVDQPRGLLRDPIATDMTPGRRLVAADDQVWVMTQVDPAEAISWLPSRLTYTQGTAAQIAHDLNEGSPRKLVFNDPIDDQQRLAGSFAPGDVDTLATVLEVKGIAHVVSRTDDRIEMAAGVQ